jgi:hypothetical protein
MVKKHPVDVSIARSAENTVTPHGSVVKINKQTYKALGESPQKSMFEE